MKLSIYRYDHPVLRKRALPIEEVDAQVVELARNMVETMIANNGVGLAANQVGQLLRIFVFREERMESDGSYSLGIPEVVINPTLTKPSQEEVSMLEGCISIPGIYPEITRPKSIHLRYQNLRGEWVGEHLHEFRARVCMHENDHLNGVLTIDRMDKRERKKVEPNLLAIKKKYNPT
jgi:peptide deformylase